MSAKKRKSNRGILLAAQSPVKITQQDGQSSIEISTEQLPPPESSYSADVAFIKEEDDEFVLVFLQLDTLSGRPVTGVNIRYSKQNFLKLSDRSTGPFFETLKKTLGEVPADSFAPDSLGGAPPLQKVLTERASIEKMSYVGGDSEIEFYHMSPGALKAAQQSSNTDGLVRPILSVHLSTRRLYFLLQAVQTLTKRGKG